MLAMREKLVASQAGGRAKGVKAENRPDNLELRSEARGVDVASLAVSPPSQKKTKPESLKLRTGPSRAKGTGCGLAPSSYLLPPSRRPVHPTLNPLLNPLAVTLNPPQEKKRKTKPWTVNPRQGVACGDAKASS